MVSAVVRSDWEGTGEVSHLQRLESSSAGDRGVKIEINQQLLVSEIEQLATFSDADPPAVTRVVFTSTDLKARAWMKDRCRSAGLIVREDAKAADRRSLKKTEPL